MSIFVIRHAQSGANRKDAPAQMENAHLTNLGREQAKKLGCDALSLGVDLYCPVAVSELLRTQETAYEAGFARIKPYRQLDEIKHGLTWPEIQEAITVRQLPDLALKRAEEILENPPKERIWITSGFVIASLCAVLGASQDKRFIPDYCEVREIFI